MHATELIIGEHAFRLPAGAATDTVVAQLLDAIRAGGGVVDIPTAVPESATSVLISPGVPVFVERIEIPDELSDLGGDGDQRTTHDWEY